MRIVFSYLDKFNVFQLIAEIFTIISKMQEQPTVVPVPNPPLVDWETAAEDAFAAAEAAKFGDRNKVAIRDEKVAILMAMTVKQGATVASVCTEIQAEGLGFRLAKSPSAPVPVDAPSDLKARPTEINHGVELSWRRSKHAYGFQVQKTLQNPMEPNAIWEDALFTNRSKVVIENVTPNLERVWFRVVAFGVKGPSAYSDPIMCAVL